MTSTICSTLIATSVLAIGQLASAQELTAIHVPAIASPAQTELVGFVGEDGASRLLLLRVFPSQPGEREQECMLPCRLPIERTAAYRMIVENGSHTSSGQWTWIPPTGFSAFALRHEPSSGGRTSLLVAGGVLIGIGAVGGTVSLLVAFAASFGCGFGGGGCGRAGPELVVGGVVGALGLGVGIPVLIVGATRPRSERVTPIDHAGVPIPLVSGTQERLIVQIPLLSLRF